MSGLPAPGYWNAALQHSLDNPTHTLIPYEDDHGSVHMDCLGDGGQDDRNCDFGTEEVTP